MNRKQVLFRVVEILVGCADLCLATALALLIICGGALLSLVALIFSAGGMSVWEEAAMLGLLFVLGPFLSALRLWTRGDRFVAGLAVYNAVCTLLSAAVLAFFLFARTASPALWTLMTPLLLAALYGANAGLLIRRKRMAASGKRFETLA